MQLPSGRWITVVEPDEYEDSYLCLLDPEHVDGYQEMDKRELWMARCVQFTTTFLMKHCKEKK